jgi:hypothetical protein
MPRNKAHGWGTGHLWDRSTKKAGARPAFLLAAEYATRYVVERGLTAMAVAGTMAVAGLGPE